MRSGNLVFVVLMQFYPFREKCKDSALFGEKATAC